MEACCKQVAGSARCALLFGALFTADVTSRGEAYATFKVGSKMAFDEILRQTVNGTVVLPPQDATSVLAGTRWTYDRSQPRLNFSQADYHGLNARRGHIIQPGITVELVDGLPFIYEYDFWRSLAPTKETTLDRGLNFVLHYHF